MSATMESSSFDASEAGLSALVTALYQAVRERDQPRLFTLLPACSLADPAAQLARLAATDRASDVLAAFATRCAPGPPIADLVNIFADAETPPLSFEARLASDLDARLRVPEVEARHPVGRVLARVAGEDDPAPLRGDWVYLDGGWRYLGLLRVVVPFPATLAGLSAALELGVLLAAAGARAELLALCEQFRLPDPERWFANHFTAGAAALLSREHESTFADLGGDLADLLRACAEAGRSEVSAKWITYGARAAMRSPAELATVTLHAPGASRGVDLGSWAVDGGGFRLVGKMRAAPDDTCE